MKYSVVIAVAVIALAQARPKEAVGYGGHVPTDLNIDADNDGQTILTMEQLYLDKGKTYNESHSMLAYWKGNLSLPDSIRDLDSNRTCLVDFPEDEFAQCKENAWVCCWQEKHKGEKPADNSQVLDSAYSDDNTHCHGSAWGAKKDSDIQWKYRMEIFNEVVCKDHGFKRGYWGGIKSAGGVTPPTIHRSCGCVENMPKISRSDCSQARVSQPVGRGLVRSGTGTWTKGKKRSGVQATSSQASSQAATGMFVLQACQGKKQTNDLVAWSETLAIKKLSNPMGSGKGVRTVGKAKSLKKHKNLV